MNIQIISIGCAAALLAVSLESGPAGAQAPHDFYTGKTINLVVGSGAGGIYDLGARLIARYLPNYIPGHPNIVVQNMPGASSVAAAEYIDNVAPRDGLTLASLQPTVMLDQSLDPTLKYRPNELTWIGRVQAIVFVGVGWKANGLGSIDDARQKASIVSAQGASGISAIIPWALNGLAGTRFKVITGYASETPAFVAMERGEVQGIGSAALVDVLAKADWTANRSVAILYTITQKRSALTPDSPAVPELAESELGGKVLTLLGEGLDIGQTLEAPPNIPSDRTEILRQAFDAMVKDSGFIADGKKVGVYVDPLNGRDLSALVSTVTSAPSDVVEKLREVARSQ